MPKSTVGRNLERARRAANLSREALAVQAGLHSATVIRIETGRGSAPRLDTLESLAAALGCTAADLLADDGVKAS